MTTRLDRVRISPSSLPAGRSGTGADGQTGTGSQEETEKTRAERQEGMRGQQRAARGQAREGKPEEDWTDRAERVKTVACEGRRAEHRPETEIAVGEQKDPRAAVVAR